MTKRTIIKLIVTGLCGCLLIGIIVVVSAVYFGVRWWQSIPQTAVSHADTYIDRYVPKSAKLLESKDDHGGFHGDGTLWRVYELAGQEKQTFETKISKDAHWQSLPLSGDLTKLLSIFDTTLPVDLASGYYFFYDFQPEWYPNSDSLNNPVHARPSFNFILIIYDPKTGKLYIDNEDT